MAKWRQAALLATLCSIFFFEVNGLYNHLHTDEEGMELERQLKVLNKVPVMTIKTNDGYIVDCIDIHKQPAFDHPLLRNHKLQRNPSFSLDGAKWRRKSQVMHQETFHVLDGCPEDTIPIRRTTKDNLMREKSLKKTYLQNHNLVPNGSPVDHFAYLTMPRPPNDSLRGAQAFIDVYNPKCGEKQFSTAEFRVSDGPSYEFSSISIGWMVNPGLYGDTHTHLFTHWTTDSFRKTGCIDMYCPGFVHVGKKLALGVVLPKTSVYGGQQWEIHIQIRQDSKTKNWWLIYGDEGYAVGYWPREIFRHFNDGASFISFGGHVKAASGEPFSPMGSGFFPDESFDHASYIRQIHYADNSYDRMVTPRDDQTYTVTDSPACYRVKRVNDSVAGEYMGYTFLFGGPGGNNC